MILDIYTNMLRAKDHPNTLRANVISTFIYLLDVCLTISVKNMNHHESWNEIKPSVAHLMIFGFIDAHIA